MDPREVSFEPLSPLSLLRRSAYVYRDKAAVISGSRRITYAQLAARVHRLASALRRAGVRAGDRVAFLSPNTPALLEAHFGVPAVGAVLVAINTRLSPQEVAYILDHCEAELLFVDAELSSIVEPIVRERATLRTIVTVEDAGTPKSLPGPTYEQFLATGSEDDALPALENEEQTISINYTSGTTGKPKGVMYTHRGAYLNALAVVAEMGMGNDAMYLWTLPMFHCNGWCFTWAVTAAGGTHICLRRIDPPEVWRIVQELRVTHLCAAPTVLIMLSSDPSTRGLRLSRRLRIATGGAPPAPTVIKNMETLGAEVTHLYGLTETYGPNTLCEWRRDWSDLPDAQRLAIKARQGVPHITAVNVRVVDDDMRDVPADGQTLGEIVMRGNTVMAGYFKQPEATEEAFRGGWFHSGDLAVLHPDGYIEIRDRKKDIIISGGENISTVEVESLIFQHPQVLEVAVIAVPDERWGEVPKAFVVPKPGEQPAPEEIIAFCRQRMAHFKCPKTVEVMAELPKTATGKIQKFVLREKEWAGYDKRVH